ncbi:MAG: hypothetical protein IKV14_05050, partial [Muribaculaceae bacterium]|nr:hypothetical protein [Muribaculaceae bacterium]
LTATPKENCNFHNWTANGEEVSKDATCTIKVTKDAEYIANFITHKVTVLAGEGGTAEVSKTQVEDNEKITLTATPKEGYSFVNWTVNGEEVSKDATYTATITADTEFKANFKATKGVENSHEWIDLGLPSGLKWATCNVGANTPEGYGDYFAWGETITKSSYSSSNYTYSSNSETLPLSADAARVNWGGKWRMPTKAEIIELENSSNCSWTWTTQNGVKGYKVTSKKNGNSIFLPAAGCRYNSNLGNAGFYGYYWSSSLDTYSSYFACYLAYYMAFSSSYVDCGLELDYHGLSVRAVCE